MHKVVVGQAAIKEWSFCGVDGFPLTPTTEILDGRLGPEKDGKTE